MKRVVIVCGATINDYDFVASFISNKDFFIFCDSGLNHIDGLKNAGIELKFDSESCLIVGDFDSHVRPEMDTETIVLPRAKDDTDSVYAIKTAIDRGFDEFILIGAIGNRIDHSLVNIYALLDLYKKGYKAIALDDYSQMEIVGPDSTNYMPGKDIEVYITSEWDYFSLITINGDAKGVTIRNAKFNLDNTDINSTYQFASSNEVAGDAPAEVSVKEGYLLLVKVRKGIS